MTRDEAMIKLLALEPATRHEIRAVTGWPVDEADETLDRLVNEGAVTYRNGLGCNQSDSTKFRWYYLKS